MTGIRPVEPSTSAVATPDSAAALAMAALFDPAHRADPYGPARVLRELRPVHRTPMGLHLVTGYRDCAAVLQGAGWSHADEAAQLHPAVAATEAAMELPTSFLWMDPPDHTRLRSLVSSAFSPRMVSVMRPRIERLAAELLDSALIDAAAGDGELDLIDRLAYPLPLTVVCELVGVPAADHGRVRQWSQDLARGFDPDFLMPPAARTARSDAAHAFMAYLGDLIELRRGEPADDLLTALIRVEDRGDVLSRAELLTTCVTMLVAGHETTVSLIGGGLLALLRRPDQLALLRDRRELVPSAVEELLRFDPPVQMTTRSATRAQVVSGHQIAPGEGVVVLLNSANRDAAAFAEPDRLDVTRYHDRDTPPARHLGFSGGIHYCLGAPLARIEMDVLLRAVLDRATGLALVTDPPPYKPNLIVRGPSAMHVRIERTP